MSTERWRNYYNELAPRYDRVARDFTWLGPKEIYKGVRPLLADNFKTLDVCSGTGFLSRLFKRLHPDNPVTALDISDKMLDRCKQHERADFIVQGNGQSLPFDDNSFDVVVNCCGLQQYPDLYGGIKEMIRVTAPNGILAFTFRFEDPGSVLSNLQNSMSENDIMDALQMTEPVSHKKIVSHYDEDNQPYIDDLFIVRPKALVPVF